MQSTTFSTDISFLDALDFGSMELDSQWVWKFGMKSQRGKKMRWRNKSILISIIDWSPYRNRAINTFIALVAAHPKYSARDNWLIVFHLKNINISLLLIMSVISYGQCIREFQSINWYNNIRLIEWNNVRITMNCQTNFCALFLATLAFPFVIFFIVSISIPQHSSMWCMAFNSDWFAWACLSSNCKHFFIMILILFQIYRTQSFNTFSSDIDISDINTYFNLNSPFPSFGESNTVNNNSSGSVSSDFTIPG